MPKAYTCDTCKNTSNKMDNWYVVTVSFGDGVGVPDLLFDKLECRDAWCAKADVMVPISPVALAAPPPPRF